MNREPCRISDDPYYDYSDYEEGRGVYSTYREEDPDEAYDRWKEQQPERPKLGSLDPLITPHVGDK